MNEILTATYNTNYNIHNVDKKIMQLFEAEKQELPNIEKDLESLKWIITNSDDIVEISKAKKRQKSLQDRLLSIQSNSKKLDYLSKTKDLLETFDLIQPPSSKVFGMKTSINKPDIHLHTRLRIIAKYLFIAAKYIPLNITRIELGEARCPKCGEKMEDKMIGLCCSSKKCGFYQDTADTMCSQKDFQQTTSKFTYDKKENFAESMRNFQGKQPKHPPKEIFEVIRNDIKKYNIDVKKMSKSNLLQIMKHNKLADYYDDLHLIYSIITETNPPDISEYEAALLQRYDLFAEIYEDYKPKDRQNSLHIPYLLQTFLIMEGYKCKTDDFHSLKTREVILEHDDVSKKVCNRLQEMYKHMNWSFTPLA